MTLNVQRLDKSYEGKRLRVEFRDGELAEIQITDAFELLGDAS